eukprot:TRINITY_DN26351_c0_g1_i1.p1 TRINITY_DN26351_c0_g1~~TRINITY_DN26351_c0_g1_i1.p1  ORF type:complete len:171 (+),score=33.80 TRINITY_DN26351_c0_g1_i1:64-576(+)
MAKGSDRQRSTTGQIQVSQAGAVPGQTTSDVTHSPTMKMMKMRTCYRLDTQADLMKLRTRYRLDTQATESDRLLNALCLDFGRVDPSQIQDFLRNQISKQEHAKTWVASHELASEASDDEDPRSFSSLASAALQPRCCLPGGGMETVCVPSETSEDVAEREEWIAELLSS